MKKVSNLIASIYTKKLLITFLIVSLILYIALLTNGFGLLENLVRESIFDMKLFYSNDFFYLHLNRLTTLQVNAYLIFHLIDYFFIFFFYPALVLYVFKIYKDKEVLLLIPISAMIFDLLENILIDIELLGSLNSLFVYILKIFTIMKFANIFISIVVSVIIKFKKEIKENVSV